MRTIKTEGIVLKSEHFSENDKILEIFTPEVGRCKVIAKGAGTSKRRFGGRIEPMNLVKMILYRGKSFYLLSQCDLAHSFLNIRNDLEKIKLSFYCIDIIRKATTFNQKNPNLFNLIHKVLNLIDSSPEHSDIKRFFERQFLHVEGLLFNESISDDEFHIVFENYTGSRISHNNNSKLFS